jgi:glycosyltransferase involved in cell wall biosynthesis
MKGNRRGFTKNNENLIVVVSPFLPSVSGESLYASALFDLISEKIREKTFIVLSARSDNASWDEVLSSNLRVLRVLREEKALKQLNFLILSYYIANLRPKILYVVNPVKRDFIGGILGEPLIIPVLWARLFGIKVIYSMHVRYYKRDIFERVVTRLRNNVISYVISSLIQSITKVSFHLANELTLLVSEGSSDEMQKFSKEYGISRMHLRNERILANFLASENMKRPKEVDEEKVKYILAFGAVSQKKGFVEAAKAFSIISSLYPEFYLIIGGKIPDDQGRAYMDELKRNVEGMGELGKRIILIDREVEDEERNWLYLNAKLFIAAYDKMLGPSGTILTALSFGIPVISTEMGSGGISFDGINMIKTSKNPEDIAHHIIEVLSRDPNLNRKSVSTEKNEILEEFEQLINL